MHANLLGPGILSDPIMFHLLGEHWEGAIVSSGVPDPNSNEPGVQRAREIFQEYAPDAQFGSFALMGMVRAELLVEGLRRAGPELTRLGLVLALEGMENWSDNILGEPITFSGENHLGFDSVRLMKAEGGVYVPVTGWLESAIPVPAPAPAPPPGE
jgi:branched-chain amino acid transport system substrate-binding protein